MKIFSFKHLITALIMPLTACTLIVRGGDDIAFCGDGELQTGEVCDDGNTNNGDNCRADCNGAEQCGDGITDTQAGVPELCDDGNTAGGDGCSADCRRIEECGNNFVDAGEECDDGNGSNGNGSTDTCDTNCTTTACGNGILTTSTGEQCDDGNNIDGDSCSSDCIVEECGNSFVDPGEQCDDGNGLNGDGCDIDCTNTACGNGVVTNGEFCDDGNAVEGDGCDTNCTASGCGNGIADSDEECDDGNAISGDGCDANCTVTTCGNNVVTTGEQCDDGNNVDNDGCTNGCLQPNCGNGITEIAFGEQCDDGNLLNNDGCDGNCTLPACGNGVQNANEQCDDGNATDNDGCRNNCQNPRCGDGILQLSNNEVCDDGNTLSGDGCNATCSRVEECGNGFVDLVGEACDDGDNLPGDGCNALCAVEFCGDGSTNGDLTLNRLDQCDDGNNTNGDGCSSVCRLEICGNGIVDAARGEVCDDGNTQSGDGCASNCLSDETCGNGILDGGEICDDGNQVSGDGCRFDCLKDEVCGDGVVDFQDVNNNNQFDPGEGEECDDGNQDVTDACPSGANGTCRISFCGDGFTQAVLEDCDDANGDELDGCNSFCETPSCANGVAEIEFCIAASTNISASSDQVIDTEVVDLNQDGHEDIISCNILSLRVFSGLGDGTFSVQTIARTAAVSGCQISVGDLDSNGTLDVLTHDSASPFTVSVFLNTGSVLQTPISTPSPSTSFFGETVLGDTNNDGNLDLLAGVSNAVLIARGNGNGTFQAPISIATSSANAEIATADLNGDNKADIVTGDGFTLGILLSNVSNGFDLSTRTITAGSNNTDIDIADTDRDGVKDIIWVREGPDSLLVFKGFGAGLFAAAPVVSSMNVVIPTEMTTGDFNNDQNLDALVIDLKNNGGINDDMLMMLGQGNGSFTESARLSVGGAVSVAISTGDFNEDGNLDAVTGSLLFDLRTHLGNGNGTLQTRQDLESSSPRNSAAGDLDGDGDDEIVIASTNIASISVVSESSGALSQQTILLLKNGGPVVPNFGISLDDMDADGDLDIIAASQFDIAIVRNDGGLQFATPVFITGFANTAGFEATGDFDGDGLSDLAVIATINGVAKLTVLRNTGNLQFAAPVILSLTNPGIDLDVADLNNDGKPELVGTCFSASFIYVFANTSTPGAISFGAETLLTSPFRSFYTALVDIDGDNDTDIVASIDGANMAIFKNQSSGSFAAPIVFSVASGVGGVEAGDLDLDGDLDLVVSNFSNAATVIFNDGTGTTFQPRIFSTNGPTNEGVSIGDINGDGALDFVVNNISANNSSFFIAAP